MEMLKNFISFILGFICLIFLLSLIGCDNSHEQQQLMTQQNQLIMQQMEQQQLMTKEIKQLEQQMKELKNYCDYLESEVSYIHEILN